MSWYTNIRRGGLLTVLVLVFACSKDSNTTVDPVMMPDETAQGPTIEEQLQSIIDAKIGPDKLLGVSISIRENGVERWQLTGGISKANEPISSDMRFGIASITKTVVGATILKLEEEGLLSTNDSIHNHLSLTSPNVDENITLFQLLNHQSGLKGYFHHPDIWPRVEGDLQTGFPASEIVQYIGDPVFAAGERYEYSNSNYLILGLIIEAVTGKSVAEVMREKFWTPLGLNTMYFGSSEPVEGTIAVPWRDSNGDGTLQDISGEYGPAYHSVFFCAADVFATVSDLSMWAQHLFNGNAITEFSRVKMLTFLQLDDPIANGYGLGVRRVLLAGRNTFGHTGGMRGYGSYMFYDPRTKVSIAMLNNQSRSENGPLFRYQLVEELLSKVFEEVE